MSEKDNIKSKSDKRPSKVWFADVAVEALEPEKTLPAKFRRMLVKQNLKKKVEGRNVGIKMHFGGNIGYSTIPTVFVRLLVEELKRCGATRITAMDNRVSDGLARGYTPEVLGCEMVSTFGNTGKYLHKHKLNFKDIDYVYFGGEALDCDFLIDLSHVKGHGDCGFGGALKNIAMGVTPMETRGKLHRLEGGIVYDPEKCDFCKKCYQACPNDAIITHKDKKRIEIFLHNCTYCQHCVLVCPEEALRMEDRRFEDFSQGMALITSEFLKKFKKRDLLFINFLLDITMFCDCWGMTTPSLVPDIGILASNDIVALDTASLDMIKTANLLPNGLPKKRRLLEGNGHLFERIHGKDPYLMVKYLEDFYGGSSEYTLSEVK